MIMKISSPREITAGITTIYPDIATLGMYSSLVYFGKVLPYIFIIFKSLSLLFFPQLTET